MCIFYFLEIVTIGILGTVLFLIKASVAVVRVTIKIIAGFIYYSAWALHKIHRYEQGSFAYAHSVKNKDTRARQSLAYNQH
jgi:hypothetical protein